MRNKYGNKKIRHDAWGVFDSELELARYIFLMNKHKNGEIKNLRRQVEYSLIPKQTRTRVEHLKTKDKIVEYVAEKEVKYRADFVYERNGEEIVEDCKGETKTYYKNGKRKVFSTQTADFVIKRKLMLYRHNIRIIIVSQATMWDN